jgi:formylglycine-generating enzyme required for sulfatase activity
MPEESGRKYFYVLKDKVWYGLYAAFLASEESSAGADLKRWGVTRKELEHPLAIRDEDAANGGFGPASTVAERDERSKWPVTNVSLKAAYSFARWLAPEGGRLPKVEEWWAAAGYHTLHDTQPGPYKASGRGVAVHSRKEPAPVGTSADDVDNPPFGCNDLAGNGFEWTCTPQITIPGATDFEITESTRWILVGQSFDRKEPLSFGQYRAETPLGILPEPDPWTGFRVLFVVSAAER